MLTAHRVFSASYFIICSQNDGSWSGIEVLSRDDCQLPHEEPEYLALVSGFENHGSALKMNNHLSTMVPLLALILMMIIFH